MLIYFHNITSEVPRINMLKKQPIKHLLFASVLKPVNDVRMWERMGRSALGTNLFDVSVIGSKSGKGSEKISDKIPVRQYPIFGGKRLGSWRLMVGFQYLKLIFEIKPDIQVISSPELIWSAITYRIWHHKSKLVYDVRENYLANILYTKSYLTLLKPILSLLIGLSEWLISKIADSIWVAEMCYIEERPLTFGKAHYLPNAYDINSGSRPMQPRRFGDQISFLISGTIGRHYGTLEAIRWVKSFRGFRNAQLIILGYCADENYRQLVLTEIDGQDWIQCHGLDQLINHSAIVEATCKADVLLLPYLPNQSTKNRIPTKLYEGLAWSVPMLIPENEIWESIIKEFNAGLVVDFNQQVTEVWVKDFYNRVFYELVHKSDLKIFWQDYEKHFLQQLAVL